MAHSSYLALSVENFLSIFFKNDGEIYTPGAAAVRFEEDQIRQQQHERQSSQRFNNNTQASMRFIASYYKMTTGTTATPGVNISKSFMKNIDKKFSTDKTKYEERVIPFLDGGKLKFSNKVKMTLDIVKNSHRLQ